VFWDSKTHNKNKILQFANEYLLFMCMFSCVILLVSIMLGANLKTHNTFYPHIGFYVNCSQIIFMHLVFSIEDDTLF